MLGTGIITVILFLLKLPQRFWRWIQPHTPQIAIGIIVGVVTTAITHFFWGSEPATISGLVSAAIAAWWLKQQAWWVKV